VVILWYLLAGIALLAGLVMLTPLELRLSYRREGQDDLLALELLLWPSFRFGYRVDLLDLRFSLPGAVLRHRQGVRRDGRPAGKTKVTRVPGLREALRQFFFWKQIFSRIKPSLGYLKKKLRLTELTWKTRFGLSDPYYTGLASGVIWSVKGCLSTFLCTQVRAARAPVLAVTPDFNQSCLAVRLELGLSTRAGHLFLAGVRIMAALLTSGRVKKMIRMIRRISGATSR